MSANIELNFIPDDSTLTSQLDRWDLYIGIIGEFEISIDGRVFFKDECFNIVEFGVQVKRWIQNKELHFHYKPLEFDSVLFEFKCENDGVIIVSEFSNYEINQPVPFSVLLEALEKYIDELSGYLQSKGYDFLALVNDVRLDSIA